MSTSLGYDALSESLRRFLWYWLSLIDWSSVDHYLHTYSGMSLWMFMFMPYLLCYIMSSDIYS